MEVGELKASMLSASPSCNHHASGKHTLHNGMKVYRRCVKPWGINGFRAEGEAVGGRNVFMQAFQIWYACRASESRFPSNPVVIRLE